MSSLLCRSLETAERVTVSFQTIEQSNQTTVFFLSKTQTIAWKMQLFYHFLGIIFVIVLIHFIFIDVQNIIHLKSINEASIHTENEHVLPSKINLRPKKVVTKLTAQDENSLMMLQINDTLSSLQSELQRLKRLKGEMKSRKQATQMIRTKTPDSTPPTDSPKIVPKKKLNALIFTMDCITSYEQNSKSGGAAGIYIVV